MYPGGPEIPLGAATEERTGAAHSCQGGLDSCLELGSSALRTPGSCKPLGEVLLLD